MIVILADHDIEGYARVLWSVIQAEGFHEMTPIGFATFPDAGLSATNTDRMVWRFAQAREMLLLTNNRNMKGDDSLEETIRQENHSSALPVITIGSIDRIKEPDYRLRCATRIMEIATEIENYKGTGRIFIP
jgi:hypothetical protein